MKHLRRWGAVYLLFIGSWLGQFFASTFENWQSEWLQLIFQAILLLGAKHWLFRVDAEDLGASPVPKVSPYSKISASSRRRTARCART
jgi:hypothetical protein